MPNKGNTKIVNKKRTLNVNKSKKRSTKQQKQSMTRKQKGGKSPSCLVKSKSPNSNYANTSCYTANLHNTNPEVDYSLITSTGMSGGACPPNVKPMTFKSYLQDVAGKLGSGVDNLSNGNLEQKMAGVDGHPTGVQSGAGFSTNPEQQIAGMPVYDKYDDCCQPALVSGKLVEGGKAGAICGNQMGGRNNRRKTQKRNNSKKSKSSKRKTQKRNNSTNSKGKRKAKKQKGGSRPADFPNESHSGLNSDFDPMGKGKNFKGKQPFWGAKTR